MVSLTVSPNLRCDCPTDCTSVTYSYTVQSKRTYYNDVCNTTPFSGKALWDGLTGTDRNAFRSLFEIKDKVRKFS